MHLNHHFFKFILLLSLLLIEPLSLFSQLLFQLLSQLLSLFSELLLCLFLKLLSLLSELLSKYALKGLKSSMIGISQLLYCHNRLLVDFRKGINRGSTNSSSSDRLNCMMRLRFLSLFVDQSLNLRSHLFGSTLLCCATGIIVIVHWMLVWLRSLRLLLFLLLGYGRLISRRGSTKVDRLVDIVFYSSLHLNSTMNMLPFAGLPVL